jgi:hypothetical protein
MLVGLPSPLSGQRPLTPLNPAALGIQCSAERQMELLD